MIVQNAHFNPPVRPARSSQPAPPPEPPPSEPDPGEGDDVLLKRAFVWGGSAAVIGAATSLASTAACAWGGPAAGLAVRVGLSLAAGIGGALYVADYLHSQPPANRVLGFLAGAGSVALTTTMGAMVAGEGALGAYAAASASFGFGLLYGGYGALVLGSRSAS